MEDVIKIASYICQRYEYLFGVRLDEMKLYKLLYFTQRECIVETGHRIFGDSFSVTASGLVVPSVHIAYCQDTLHERLSEEALSAYRPVFDHVFNTYAPKDDFGLTTLIQNEHSWKKAAEELGIGHCIQTADIAKDAERIRNRRFLLKHLSDFRKPTYA